MRKVHATVPPPPGLFVTDKLVGVRVNEDDEQMGLDLSQHSETAYTAEGGGTSIHS